MDAENISQSPPARLNSIGITIMGVIMAFVLIAIFFFWVFFYNIPLVFYAFGFVTTLALGLLLPRFKYSHTTTPFLVLTAWFVIMSFSWPLLDRTFYMTIATTATLPSFSSQIVNVSYGAYEGFDAGGPYITYSYSTTNQQQDYLKMKELYKSKFNDVQKWSVFEGSEQGQSYITFTKMGYSSQRVTLVIDEKTPNLIKVGISF